MTQRLSFEQKTKLVGNDVLYHGSNRRNIPNAAPRQTESLQPKSDIIAATEPRNEESSALFKNDDGVARSKLEVNKKYNFSTSYALDLFVIVLLAYIAFLTSWVYICFGAYLIMMFTLKYDYKRIVVSSITCAILVPILAITGRSLIAKSFLVFVVGFAIVGLIRFILQRAESKKLVYNS